MGCDTPWKPTVTCAIQSVAIEPPGVRATKRLDTASIALLRGSVAVLFHRSCIKRARIEVVPGPLARPLGRPCYGVLRSRSRREREDRREPIEILIY
jgi:hypothetical protein